MHRRIRQIQSYIFAYQSLIWSVKSFHDCWSENKKTIWKICARSCPKIMSFETRASCHLTIFLNENTRSRTYLRHFLYMFSQLWTRRFDGPVVASNGISYQFTTRKKTKNGRKQLSLVAKTTAIPYIHIGKIALKQTRAGRKWCSQSDNMM